MPNTAYIEKKINTLPLFEQRLNVHFKHHGQQCSTNPLLNTLIPKTQTCWVLMRENNSRRRAAPRWSQLQQRPHEFAQSLTPALGQPQKPHVTPLSIQPSPLLALEAALQQWQGFRSQCLPDSGKRYRIWVHRTKAENTSKIIQSSHLEVILNDGKN